MKIRKIIATILVLVLTFQIISPIGVLALEQTSAENNTKDTLESENNQAKIEKNFDYKISLLDTFDIIYNNKKKEDIIKTYIQNEITSDGEITINLAEDENTYTITKENEEIYSGSFTYSLYDTLEIPIHQEDKIEAISTYIKNNTNCKENIEITEKSADEYEISINKITSTFKVKFTQLENNSSANENINQTDQLQTEAITSSLWPTITYQTHIQNIGWQSTVSDGATSGTTGQSKRLEAIKINVSSEDYTGDIEYKTYIESKGWENIWHKNGEESGTTGEGKQLEAIQIRLTGEMEAHYDVYYRVHAKNYGWLDWAKNGEKAGSTEFGYRLEAIEIVLVEKGEKAPGSTTRPYAQRYISYQTHIQNIGWQSTVYDKTTSGTVGQSKRLEAIKINLSNPKYTGDIEYKTYIESKGWENIWHKNGEESGTTGEGKQLEAIQIRLTGEMEAHYDVYYRVHAKNYGWLDWAKNGEKAGTIGFGYRLEAIEIVLVEKGGKAPGSTTRPYAQRYIAYQTHIQNIGWQSTVYDGTTSGTVGQSKRLEAIKINLSNADYTGNIEYKTYIESKGWENIWHKNGEESGTTGEGKQLEAIQIRLTGEMEAHYDVYYRVHAKSYGWLDWAKNGEKAGTIGFGYRLEAIEVILVEKNASAPGNTETAFVRKDVTYQAHNSNVGWQSTVEGGTIAGTIGKNLEAFKVNIIQSEYTGNISYTSYVNNIGWQSYVSNGQTSGTTGKGATIEAIRIKLSGQIANYYDIYYRVYISNIGWLDWACNDQATGNIGYKNSVQSLQVQLIEKGSTAPGETQNIYSEDELKLNYSSYVESTGWQPFVNDGELSGTSGESKKLESIKIEVNKKTITGTVSYSTHISGSGWQNYVSDGEVAGKIGGRIEAIKIKLTGDLENEYDIYYRVHVANVGWMAWTSNDNPAGTTGGGKRIEGIEIKLIKKGEPAPENIGNNTEHSYLEAYWETREDGNKYYYDINGNLITGSGYTIGDVTYYFGPTGIYLGTKNLKVIDVSAHQKEIDWQQVSSSGIYGVILRIAAGCEEEDEYLSQYIAEVKKYNIPYGIYIYSYAEDYNEGVLYAKFTQQIINKYQMNPTLGIYLDLESNIITSYMGPEEYTQVVQGFMSVIPNANIYTYRNYADNELNTAYIRSYITWIAEYNPTCAYTGSYKMWQYTSTATLQGISGNVDMSILYTI